jgi:hypothetical protein
MSTGVGARLFAITAAPMQAVTIPADNARYPVLSDRQRARLRSYGAPDRVATGDLLYPADSPATTEPLS